MNKTVLVVAAHPDDEVLGCGGTIAKHIYDGDQVFVAIMAEGIKSRSFGKSHSADLAKIKALKESAMCAHKILGTTSVEFLDFPDNQMDSVCLLEVIKKIEYLVEKYKPKIVYTHHFGDLNIDHKVVNQAVVTACRPLPDSIIETLLFFEIPSSTEWQVAASSLVFNPNWFVNVSSFLELKIEALKKYESEMRDFPHPRSIKGVEYLSGWRGASIGIKSAEAFILGRVVLF